MPRLEGQVALVTGGGSGLGRAIVERFIAEGARLGVLEKSAQKAEQIEADFGAQVAVTVGDAASLPDNDSAVALTIGKFGQLDTFIGNAAIWDFGISLIDLPADRIDQAFDELFAVNVKGYVVGARAAARPLLESRGSMIFTLSNAAFYPAGGGPLYTAAKHAGVGLVRQLAYELAPKVRVNAVAPGGMATDLRGPAALGMQDRSIAAVRGSSGEDRTRLVPLQIDPESRDYAAHYVMLASRHEARAMTGAIINCDGGLGVRGIRQVAGGAHL
jgi:NAD(P)-dependent dehydrogenase (short-subunit alcohol dehydrogenase family)